ncbi:carboxypeptidase-like regulatory domain-containing protein [Mesonia maritima]|uniref:Carboxypeptidase-like regulatory domain-containing protein n=1 Tax=Mesonia maritima TaxID=1793873 RepID=A0ABU1K6Y8_9FLAO|nr:carboxypeptidase-like regulatory domain-containing protein [Mesonia maritima]MDR6301373.1 hypothetical protein [Mesonia maritima]
MCKNRLLFGLLVVLYFPLSAQTLSGIILSNETEKGIPNATVEISQNYGVITNQNGNFEIEVDKFSSTDSLRFSSLGYQSLKIAIKDFKKDTIIHLNKKVDQLDDVYLVNKNIEAQKIIEKAKQNINKNYSLDSLEFKIRHKLTEKYIFNDFDLKLKKINLIPKSQRVKFTTDIKKIIDEIKNTEHILEKFNSFSYKQFPHSKPKIERIEESYSVTKHNPTLVNSWYYALDKVIKSYIDINKEYQVKSGIISFDRDYKLQVDSTKLYYQLTWPKQYFLNPAEYDFLKNSEDYSFEIKEVIQFNENWYYQIAFKPNKAKAKFQGTLYISTSDYGILKGEYELGEGEKLSSFNLKFPIGAKLEENIASGSFMYTKLTSGKYSPKYYLKKTGEYNYLHRDYRLKLKDSNWLTPSKKITSNLLIDGQKITENQYYFSDKD